MDLAFQKKKKKKGDMEYGATHAFEWTWHMIIGQNIWTWLCFQLQGLL